MMLVAFLSAALLAQGSPEAAPAAPNKPATSTAKPAAATQTKKKSPRTASTKKTATPAETPAAKPAPAEAAAEPQAPAAASETPAATPAAAGAADAKAAPGDIAAGLKAFRARRFAAAKAAFEKAFEADPKSAAAAYYLGYTLYKMGEPQRHMNPNKEKAKELFATAFSLDSEFKPTFKAQ